MSELLPLAQHGNASAQYEIGRMYEGGRGVGKDYSAAASWYRKASMAGDHRAQLLLALMYARGQGVPQDDKQGLYWLSKAGEGDPPQKQQALKMFYAMNRGGYDNGKPLDESEIAARGAPALQAMADRGDPHAKCALSQLYGAHPSLARPIDNLAALRDTCVKQGYIRTGAPPPPGLALPPPRN